MLAALAVISTLHLEGDVTPDGGDYVDVPFTVPAGTVEFSIARTYTTGYPILDFGVWAPEGNRGWSGGLKDDIVIGVDQSSRGYVPGAVTAGTGWTLVIGKALLDASGAHYTVDITFNDAASLPVLPKADYTPVVMSTERRWYKGDFHVHSTQSGDAGGTPDEDVTLGHMRGLDFFNMSDHNTIAQQALTAASQPSWPVLVLRGAEITTYGGHGNGDGISNYVDHRIGYDGRTVTDIVNDVQAQGGIYLVNHPATDLGTNCIGCAWTHEADAPWDDISGIEVLTSGWETSVEAFTPAVLQMWDSLEDAGHRIAAVGGSDDHSAGMNEGATGAPVGQPCTNVLADELSEDAIISAVKARHTVIQLRGCDDPFVEPKLGDAEVGDEVSNVAHADFTVHVTGGDGTFLQLWRDGVKLEQKPVSGADATIPFSDTPGAATHRYRFELIDGANRRLVITSHFYVDGVAAPGGCSAGGGGAGGGVLGLMGVALLRARRRRAR